MFIASFSILGAVSVYFERTALTQEVTARNTEAATIVAAESDHYITNQLSNLQLISHQISQGFMIFDNKNATTDTHFFDPANPATSPLSALSLSSLKQVSGNPYQVLALIDKDGNQVYATTSRPPAPPSPPPTSSSTVITKSNTTLPYLENASTSADNTNVSHTDPVTQPNLANDPVYTQPKLGHTYISEVYFQKDTNIPLVTISVPLTDSQNHFLGAVMAEISFSQFLQSVFEVRKSPNGVITTIVAKQSHKKAVVVIGSTQPTLSGQLNYQEQWTTIASSSGSSGERTSFNVVASDGQTYLTSYAPLQNLTGWGVLVSQSSDEAYSIINQLTWPALLAILIAIVITSFVGVLVSRSITQPVRNLALAANHITTTGNLDEQIKLSSQDEVGQLAASFNDMILALRKTKQALEHWNRELGHKVEARTHELTVINARLEETNRELEQASLHKSQFLANMSHELRTPLNAIIGFSEVLQDQIFGELNAKQLRYVDNIVNSGRHLLNLVNDVLDLSKVDAGKMELHIEEFSCNQVIQEIQVGLGEMLARKGLEAHIRVEAGLDMIKADRARYRQVLYNLISNAIKFTLPQGCITISGKYGVVNEHQEGATVAIFTVEDTGIGISPENQSYIFESFRQVDSSYARQYQGTGLGLTLTRKLIEMHGGQIWVESELNKGSKFHFTLPLGASNYSPNFS
jgi:signal transduction histidine kinase